MKEPTLRGGRNWIIGALCAGAVLGAAIDSAQYLKGIHDVLGRAHLQEYGVSKGTRIFVLTSIVWLAGLSALGGPAWFALHRRNVRGWAAAMLLGALLTFTLDLYFATGFGLSRRDTEHGFQAWSEGGPTYIENVVTPHGWAIGLKNAGLFGLEGAVVGLVVWRVAYRRGDRRKPMPTTLPADRYSAGSL